jgi:hypothetical protein
MATTLCAIRGATAAAAAPHARGGVRSRAAARIITNKVSSTTRPPKSRRGGVVVLAAASSEGGDLESSPDLEPEARDFTGDLRMPPPVVEVPVELPCMLFQSQEMLLPGCTQVLHLYEARFLALLDEVSTSTGGLFAHVTVGLYTFANPVDP